MSLKKLHIRYAQALYNRAKKERVLSEVAQDVQTLSAVYEHLNSFKSFLRNPLVKPVQKIKILDQALAEHLHATTLTFLSFLVTKKRESQLSAILQQFKAIHKAEQHIKTAYLTTVRAISPELRKALMAHIQDITHHQDVELIEGIDPTLIGGYVLKIRDQQLDMSIRTQLQRLANHWEKSPLPELNPPTA